MMRAAQRLFLWTGIAVLAYAGGMTAYSEAYQRYQSREFDKVISSGGPEAADLHEGDVVGKLEIPRIELSVVIFQGAEESTLRVGAGHVPGTPLPGAGGNVAIAAHRDTYFRKLKDIEPGDKIRVSLALRTFEYVVESTETVDPQDTRAMESHAGEELTLITCFPFYYVGSAPKRFIVHAVIAVQKP